jgi:predicted DNA-binding transcriptional regulator AlpA
MPHGARLLPVASRQSEGRIMADHRDELLTVSDVLHLLGNVSRRTFYRWRETGKAPEAVRLPNGELRIWRSDLNAWLDALREERAA